MDVRPERVSTSSGDGKRLSLLNALPVLYSECAGLQVGVVAELAVIVLDGDVVPKGVGAQVLTRSEIESIKLRRKLQGPLPDDLISNN